MVRCSVDEIVFMALLRSARRSIRPAHRSDATRNGRTGLRRSVALCLFCPLVLHRRHALVILRLTEAALRSSWIMAQLPSLRSAASPIDLPEIAWEEKPSRRVNAPLRRHRESEKGNAGSTSCLLRHTLSGICLTFRHVRLVLHQCGTAAAPGRQKGICHRS